MALQSGLSTLQSGLGRGRMTGIKYGRLLLAAEQRRARLGASTAAIAMMLAMPSWAQTAADTTATSATTGGAGQAASGDNNSTVAEVVVTGIRGQVQSSTQRKRNFEQMVD